MIILWLDFARVYHIVLIIDNEAIFLNLFYLLCFFLRGLQILVKFDSRLIFDLDVSCQIKDLLRHLLLKVLRSLQVHLFDLLLHLLDDLGLLGLLGHLLDTIRDLLRYPRLLYLLGDLFSSICHLLSNL